MNYTGAMALILAKCPEPLGPGITDELAVKTSRVLVADENGATTYTGYNKDDEEIFNVRIEYNAGALKGSAVLE
jgi:hypothetical protein